MSFQAHGVQSTVYPRLSGPGHHSFVSLAMLPQNAEELLHEGEITFSFKDPYVAGSPGNGSPSKEGDSQLE